MGEGGGGGGWDWFPVQSGGKTVVRHNVAPLVYLCPAQRDVPALSLRRPPVSTRSATGSDRWSNSGLISVLLEVAVMVIVVVSDSAGTVTLLGEGRGGRGFYIWQPLIGSDSRPLPFFLFPAEREFVLRESLLFGRLDTIWKFCSVPTSHSSAPIE